MIQNIGSIGSFDYLTKVTDQSLNTEAKSTIPSGNQADTGTTWMTCDASC